MQPTISEHDNECKEGLNIVFVTFLVPFGFSTFRIEVITSPFPMWTQTLQCSSLTSPCQLVEVSELE